MKIGQNVIRKKFELWKVMGDIAKHLHRIVGNWRWGHTCPVINYTFSVIVLFCCLDKKNRQISRFHEIILFTDFHLCFFSRGLKESLEKGLDSWHMRKNICFLVSESLQNASEKTKRKKMTNGSKSGNNWEDVEKSNSEKSSQPLLTNNLYLQISM